jgi:hypothetical protein
VTRSQSGLARKWRAKIPLDQGPEPLNAYNENKRIYNRAKICELWDKETQKVYWF